MTARQTFDWQTLAKCVGQPSSYFFQDEEGVHGDDEYTGLCRQCPVKSICLEDAIVYGYSGVWGGMTERERNMKFGKEYRDYIISERQELGDYLELKATG